MDRVAVSTEPATTPDLALRLSDSMIGATRTQKTIASYFLQNFKTLPFETAASVAQKMGVSEASIGRYCRAIGFQHFKDLKASLQADLGDQAWLIGDRLRDFNARSREGQTEQSRALEREIAAIVANHETATTPAFARVVERLAHAPHVYVAGFQTERGHAAYLAHNLQYLRAGVTLADLSDGHFADVLLTDPAQTCLILIDARRYSRITKALAQAAYEAGIPVTLITDPYCDWAHGVATEVLVVQTDLNQFWDGTSPMASLAGLLVNAVFNELGPQVETRMARVSGFYNDFIGHSGVSGGPLK